MLDDTEVTSSDIKKYLQPVYIRKFLHMSKEDKQPILNDIKIKIIMTSLLTNNTQQYLNLNHDALYKKVIKDIENYKQ
jgi:hypothetical protein